MNRRTAAVIAAAAVVLLSCHRREPPAAGAGKSSTSTSVTVDKPLDLNKKEIDQKIPAVPPFVDANAIGPKLGPDGTVMGEKKTFKTSEPINLTMKFHDSPKGLVANFTIEDMKFKTIHHEERPMNGSKVVTFTVPPKTLKPGRYRVEGYWGGNLAVEYVIEVQ
jgi:hypothetical protein